MNSVPNDDGLSALMLKRSIQREGQLALSLIAGVTTAAPAVAAMESARPVTASSPTVNGETVGSRIDTSA